MDETTTTTNEGTATARESTVTSKKRATPADQDQRIANDITEAETFLGVIAADSELITLLSTRGIDSAELATANTLLQSAKDTFTQRQSKLGAETSAFTSVTQQEAPINKDFADFRVLCRKRLTEKGAQQALGLTGRVPTDRQKRITLIRTAYTEAKKAEHRVQLDKLGYTVAELDRLLSTVQSFEATIETARRATGAAQQATEARNAAIKALREWLSTARLTAKRVLATRPDLLTPLGL